MNVIVIIYMKSGNTIRTLFSADEYTNLLTIFNDPGKILHMHDERKRVITERLIPVKNIEYLEVEF